VELDEEHNREDTHDVQHSLGKIAGLVGRQRVVVHHQLHLQCDHKVLLGKEDEFGSRTYLSQLGVGGESDANVGDFPIEIISKFFVPGYSHGTTKFCVLHQSLNYIF